MKWPLICVIYDLQNQSTTCIFNTYDYKIKGVINEWHKQIGFPDPTRVLRMGSGDFAKPWHYGDVKMGAISSQITSLTIVYSTVYSDADRRKHHSSASLAFVRGIHREPVNSPHKWPVTRKMFPFDDVIMVNTISISVSMSGWIRVFLFDEI